MKFNIFALFKKKKSERLLYRRYLLEELLEKMGADYFDGKRIFELGPKDGVDSQRLSKLRPSELVMMDLPEKNERLQASIKKIKVNHKLVTGNFMYIEPEIFKALGKFDLIWCTGVLYHNPEQLRMIKRLYKLCNPEGVIVLESATLRSNSELAKGRFVEIFYPETYRDTGTITHLPSAPAIEAWLCMAGFSDVKKSKCFARYDKDLDKHRAAFIGINHGGNNGQNYYYKSGLNPEYKIGDSE